MASASTAKRSGAGMKLGGVKNDANRESSSAVQLSVAKTKDVHKTEESEVEPNFASLSEKRRFAAMISWEKRRKALDKKTFAAKGAARKSNSSAASASATHVKGKSKMRSMQKMHHPTSASAATQPPTKKRKIETELTALAIRSNAAKLGWEKRRSVAAANSNGESTSSHASSADSDPVAQGTSSFKTKAANKQRGGKDAIAVKISDANKLGWDRRRNQIAAERSTGSSTCDDASSGEAGIEKKTAASSKKIYTAADRRKAALAGWAKIRAERNAGSLTSYDASSGDRQSFTEGASGSPVHKKTAAASKKVYTAAERRKAALAGWAKIRAERGAGSSTSDDASSGERQSFAEGASGSPVNKKTATALKKVYTAAERRKAALVGWEKRKAARMYTGLSSISDFETSVTTVSSISLNSALPTMPTLTKEIKNYREGKTRSCRHAEESTESYEDEVRKVNKIVSYLRQSRGWLEFRPSSRRGMCTATYGYIPSSIASFIRDGTISQRTVLDYGTLGVHYALDWHGYGGLKDMIATFGEDYSPHPTEEMMEQSRNTEWELGDDLPWREILENEKKKLTMIAAREQEQINIDEDVLIVAAILANLDRSVTEECVQDDREIFKSKEKGRSAVPSTSHVTLKDISRIYDSSDEYNDSGKEDCKTQEVKNTLPQMVDHQASTKIATQVFSNWNFGLS